MAEAKSPAKKCVCNFLTQYQKWASGGVIEITFEIYLVERYMLE